MNTEGINSVGNVEEIIRETFGDEERIISVEDCSRGCDNIITIVSLKKVRLRKIYRPYLNNISRMAESFCVDQRRIDSINSHYIILKCNLE